MTTKRVILLAAALLFFAHSLAALHRYLEAERKRLDPTLRSRNLKRRSYFEKHFILSRGEKVFGGVSVLFEAGIQSSVHLDGRMRFSLLEKNRTVSFSLSVFADRFRSVERFVIFLNSPDFSGPIRIEGTFAGTKLEALVESGGARQRFELPFAYRPKLRNPLYPFHETLNPLERTRRFPVPRSLYFRDPLSRAPVSFALSPLEESIRFRGRTARGFRLEKTPVPVRFYFFADGQFAGARIASIRVAPSEKDLLEPESAISFSNQWMHSNLRELKQWFAKFPVLLKNTPRAGG